MMDVVTISKYVSEMVELVDYLKADTNADCVIDAIKAITDKYTEFALVKLLNYKFIMSIDDNAESLLAYDENDKVSKTFSQLASGKSVSIDTIDLLAAIGDTKDDGVVNGDDLDIMLRYIIDEIDTLHS